MSVNIASIQKFMKPASAGPYTDDFQAYSTGNLNGQGDWIAIRYTIAVMDSGGDKRICANYSDDCCVAYNKPLNANQYAQITIDAYATGSAIGVAVRCSVASGIYFYNLSFATGTWYLDKYVNGVYTSLDTYAGTAVSAGSIIKLSISGNVLSCYHNGSLITGLGTNGTFEDGDIATGIAGLAAYGSTTTFNADNFECGNL